MASPTPALLPRLVDTFRRLLPPSRSFDVKAVLPPPWIVAPEWPADSMGWRMGGEAHFFAVQDAYKALTPAEQAAYERAYPPPAGWEQYLDRHRRGWRLRR